MGGENTERAALFIGGPTGIGKTKLAEELAFPLDGEIVSCDSRAIYRFLNIGTGKTSNSNDITYHMVDLICPGEVIPVHPLVLMARKKIDEITQRGFTPIICGGSHFWMERVLKGMRSAPSPDPDLRRYLNSLRGKEKRHILHEMLMEENLDLAKKVHPNNIQRIIRYLERSLIEEKVPGIEPFKKPHVVIFLSGSIKSIRSSIEKRTSTLIDEGLIDEVEGLINLGIVPPMAGTDSIGYPWIYKYLEGKMGIEECIRSINSDTVKLARSQMKWIKRFRNPRVFDVNKTSMKEIAESVKYLFGSGI